LLGTPKAQRTAKVSCNSEIMEYTRIRNAATVSSLRSPDANVLRWLQQFLHETGSVTAAGRADAGRPPIVRTPANEGTIIAAL
jgi:hypothetical protein